MRTNRLVLLAALFALVAAPTAVAQSEDLRVTQVIPAPGGDVVRLTQYFQGIPVFGGELVRDARGQDQLGKLTQSAAGVFPPNGAEAAKQVFGSTQEIKAEPYWYDATLLGDAGTGHAVPAFVVTTPQRTAIVRAADNAVVASWDNQHEALNRVLCDADSARFDVTNGAWNTWRCGPAVAVTRAEADPAAGIADVDLIHQYFGDTSEYYRKLGLDLTGTIGVDYADGRGKALRATVRGCSNEQCPYVNAFWDGRQMFFGSGLSTDDITAHELTHGVTQHFSKLVYRGESGAINEALSDINGEFVDLTNGSADDTAANRWKLGEGSSIGVIRDMKTPENHKQPSTYKGRYWYTGTADNGGVHTNSGVGNKVAYLIADPGKLGITKSGFLWARVQATLTSTSNYADLGKALNNGCAVLARNGTAGITTADCTEVSKAVKAVKIG
ncbi:M4 family peptidase [Pseudonocardiaceae bacterium YIM PH 21723]|nr:M4 family peptidase [Pseudonocardiaceae bacterium YIM PH 21723]